MFKKREKYNLKKNCLNILPNVGNHKIETKTLNCATLLLGRTKWEIVNLLGQLTRVY
jgi:hypothetical protein